MNKNAIIVIVIGILLIIVGSIIFSIRDREIRTYYKVYPPGDPNAGQLYKTERSEPIQPYALYGGLLILAGFSSIVSGIFYQMGIYSKKISPKSER